MSDFQASPHVQLAERIAAQYRRIAEVQAVVLAGSRAAGAADGGSDIDLYVYCDAPIPLTERGAIATAAASRADFDNRFWEDGDEWVDADTGVTVDVTYRSPRWIEEQLDSVLVYYAASTGYSTCFWSNVLFSQPLFDRTGWYWRLQASANQPYPDGLRYAVVAKNYPILRDVISSYLNQIQKAVKRGDAVHLHHCVTALLASYFDILFAVNRLPHPGEKRQITILEQRAESTPPHLREDVERLLSASARPDSSVIDAAGTLLDTLDAWLAVIAPHLAASVRGGRE
jgi:hypothetical protein